MKRFNTNLFVYLFVMYTKGKLIISEYKKSELISE